MSQTFQNLAQIQPASGNVESTVTVPVGQTWIFNIRVCNVSGAAGATDTYRIRHAINGAGSASSQYISLDAQLGNQTDDLKQGFIANAGDVLAFASGNGEITFNLYGEIIQ